MAAPKKKEYISKAIVNTIKATSRISIKVNYRGSDDFYTLEYTEERMIPAVEGVDIEKERKILWDKVNAEVDNQIEDVYKLYEKK